MLRLICWYAPQSGRRLEEKQSFYDDLKCEWDMHTTEDLFMCLGDFNGHVGTHIDGFYGVHGGYGVGQRNLDGSMLLEFSLVKELCVSNTWFKREEKMKATFRMGENVTEIDFLLIKKEHRQFIKKVKAISGEFQHALVIADIDKRKIMKVVRKTCAEKRKITLLKDVKIRKQFEENVTDLVNVGALNLWGHIMDGGLMACVGRRGGGEVN